MIERKVVDQQAYDNFVAVANKFDKSHIRKTEPETDPKEVIITEEAVVFPSWEDIKRGMDHLEPPQPPGEERADRFNEGKVDLTLIDPWASEGLARVLEFGMEKYSRDNWRKGLPILEILASLQRHYNSLLKGEQFAKDSGLPHVDHIAANAMFLSYFHHTEDKE